MITTEKQILELADDFLERWETSWKINEAFKGAFSAGVHYGSVVGGELR